MLSNFCSNLRLRHIVNCFNTYDASIEAVSFKTLFQFALCLTRTEYQNSFCIPNARNYRIVVNVEMSRKGSLAAVILRHLE